MKRNLIRALYILAACAALAAIWLPGAWWQWLLTALVLFTAAAFNAFTQAIQKAVQPPSQDDFTLAPPAPKESQ